MMLEQSKGYKGSIFFFFRIDRFISFGSVELNLVLVCICVFKIDTVRTNVYVLYSL